MQTRALQAHQIDLLYRAVACRLKWWVGLGGLDTEEQDGRGPKEGESELGSVISSL